MGGKKKSSAPEAPEYSPATYSTGGLFGSSTSDKKGTSFNPTGKISQIGGNSWSGLGNALNQINNFNNRDFSKDANYQVYANRLNDMMRENYNNDVLNTLANNGLMRTSGLQAATNAFNDTLAKQTADLYDRYSNNQLNYLNNRLSANQNTLNNLYSYITGVNNGAINNANQISNFDLHNYQNKLAQYQAEQEQNKNKSGLWSKIGSAAGAAAGAYFGGGNPMAAKLGSMAGEKLGGMADK